MSNRIGKSLGRLAAAAFLFAGAATAAQAATLDDVRKRGALNCGVSQGLPGFSDRDAQGVWSGFDVDFCKALAAAVFGDASKVTYTPLSALERFEALRTGQIDVLSRNSTWTLEREATMGLLFAGITYHDGQGFLVLRRPQIISALELDGAAVCVQSGTTSQANLSDFMRANSMTYKELMFPTLVEAMKALESGQCDVFTADQSALFAERIKLSNPAGAVILPDVISKEPLGPVTRADDVKWFNIVRWVNYALINAEELGISTATIAEASASQKPAVRRFVGAQGDLGQALGLNNAWALRAVQAVGNYAEIFERNIGSGSRLGVPRGLNQLWSTGGILYAPPLQ
jgi:general L-amino acid transport system substrate-binding protein